MKTSSKILIALGAGFAIGGIIGILFAPDKGSETRRKISDTSKKFADKVNEQIKKAKAKGEEVLSKVNGEMEEA